MPCGFSGDTGTRHHEPDPVAALRVHHEHLPVEVEKHIEGRVTGFRHDVWLSDQGNSIKENGWLGVDGALFLDYR